MEKILIQITAGRGPVECGRVVAKVQEKILRQIRFNGESAELISCKKGDMKGTLHSVHLLYHPKNDLLKKEWSGTIQWIASSPFRTMHKRKNWFVGVAFFEMPQQLKWKESDIFFETCRASGPGGQHVNKVETAVRGTHIPSGIQVLVIDSRSQLQNKKLCRHRLQEKVQAWHAIQLGEQQQQQ